MVGKNHRIETVVDNLYGFANKIDATIGLSTSHSLLVGDNMLTIQVHNVGQTSSDMSSNFFFRVIY